MTITPPDFTTATDALNDAALAEARGLVADMLTDREHALNTLTNPDAPEYDSAITPAQINEQFTTTLNAVASALCVDPVSLLPRPRPATPADKPRRTPPTPATPATPATPDTPTTPTTPAAPAAPDTPDTPDTPTSTPATPAHQTDQFTLDPSGRWLTDKNGVYFPCGNTSAPCPFRNDAPEIQWRDFMGRVVPRLTAARGQPVSPDTMPQPSHTIVDATLDDPMLPPDMTPVVGEGCFDQMLVTLYFTLSTDDVAQAFDRDTYAVGPVGSMMFDAQGNLVRPVVAWAHLPRDMFLSDAAYEHYNATYAGQIAERHTDGDAEGHRRPYVELTPDMGAHIETYTRLHAEHVHYVLSERAALNSDDDDLAEQAAQRKAAYEAQSRYLTAEPANNTAAEQALIEYIKHRLEYDPSTGLVLWANMPRHTPEALRRRIGMPAGSRNKKDGRYTVRIKYRGATLSMSHAKLVWILVKGTIPRGVVRHLDGNPANTRIDNLHDRVARQTKQQQIKIPRSKAWRLRHAAKQYMREIDALLQRGEIVTPEMAAEIKAKYMPEPEDQPEPADQPEPE